ncbi:hypothetical protein [Tissierella praeacuta]|uniref:hypothetical protein n=1 Tax=Tissierella praeacuta TaxID=43131 RepID=UPI003342596A
MKRYICFFGIIFFLFAMMGCNGKINTLKSTNSHNVRIGVVETTAMEYKSIIHWYDDNLNKVSEQKLKYAMLGTVFNNPVYTKDEVYMIPQGLGNKKDSKKVISINKKDMKIKEYTINQIGLNGVAVSGDYIYTINTFNGDTYISRLNKFNNELEEIILNNEYISGLTAVRGKIYAFSSNLSTISPELNLYIYNEDLELIDKKDITKYGTSQYKFMHDEDSLYTGVMITKEDEPSNIILQISLNSNKVEAINTGEYYPNDILLYKDNIIVTHNDLVINEGNTLTVLDKDCQAVRVIDLENKTELAGILKNYLVVGNQEKICLYDIEDNFKLTKEKSIQKGENSYISNIIILE